MGNRRLFDESAVFRHANWTVYGRGRKIADTAGNVKARRVQAGKVAVVTAQVKSGLRGSGGPYSCKLCVDAHAGAIIDYSCTCPAHASYSGMCKHNVALALTFLRDPESFSGYDELFEPETTYELQDFMAKRLPAARAATVGAGMGNVDLELTVQQAQRYGMSGFTVKFSLATPTAKYVIKDISSFLQRIRNREFFKYGKNLAFTHGMECFTPRACAVVGLLMRVEDTTKAIGFHSYYRHGDGDIGRFITLGPAQLIELIDLYADAPFLYEGPFARGQLRTQVVEGNPPIEFSLTEGKKGQVEITGPNEPVDVLRFGDRTYCFFRTLFYRCTPDFAPAADFLQSVYCETAERLTVVQKDLPRFCATLLPMLEEHFGVEAPPRLAALRPKPCRLQFYLDYVNEECECLALALYGSVCCNALDPNAPAVQLPSDDPGGRLIGEALANVPHAKVQPVRDVSAEDAARDALARYLPEITPEGHARTAGADDFGDLLFFGLSELRDLGDVFTTPAFDRVVRVRRPQVKVGVSLVANLINMKVEATDIEEAELAALLASYRKRKRYHRLSDGSIVSLAEAAAHEAGLDELESLAAGLDLSAADLQAAVGDGVEFGLAKAFLIDDELEDDCKEAGFREFVRGFRTGDGFQEHRVPAALSGVLRPYQKDGFAWLNRLSDTGLAGILADEMGLGKSVQVISWLTDHASDLAQAPALVVCPASLVYNWLAEFEKFAPSLRVVAVSGSKPERERARGEACEAFVTSYDSLRIDAQEWAQANLFACIIDEAQYIKNHATKVARAVKGIRAQHRFALTGTPIENRLSELWSIFDFLMPGMLGRYNLFKERFELPIVGGSDACRERLASLVGPFILRRRKADVLADLPEKTELPLMCRMEKEQRRLYDAHELRLRKQLEGETGAFAATDRIQMLAELTRLRQLCCDPRLVYEDAGVAGVKVGAVCDLVQSAWDGGQKTLVFSQFTSFLELIADQLRHRGLTFYEITGKTPKKKRVELVDAFNANDTPAFLVSLKAGGTGLNLVGASVVVHADPWWNAAAQNQATDRAHRIGQTRAVTVYQVIAQDSIEERIMKLQQAKADLASAVLQADGQSLGQLSREEIAALLTSACS